MCVSGCLIDPGLRSISPDSGMLVELTSSSNTLSSSHKLGLEVRVRDRAKGSPVSHSLIALKYEDVLTF